MSPRFTGRAAGSDARDWIAAALSEETGTSDTHPSLARRLEALGVTPDADSLISSAGAIGETAADEFLGDAAPELLDGLDQRWHDAVAAHWSARHEYVRGLEERAAVLEAKSKTCGLSVDELKERAQAALELQGPEEALPLLRDAAAAAPDDAPTRFTIGRLLAERDDDEALEHLDAAMTSEFELVPACCHVAASLLHRLGRSEAAGAYARRLGEHTALLARLQEERRPDRVSAKDAFGPHALAADAIAAIVEHLRRYRGIARAYLVRKEVELLPERPFYILGIVPVGTWGYSGIRDRSREIVHNLARDVPFPGDAVVVLLAGERRRLRKCFRRIPESQIYDAGRAKAAS